MQCYLESDCSANVKIVSTALGGFNHFMKNLRCVFVCMCITLYKCSQLLGKLELFKEIGY